MSDLQTKLGGGLNKIQDGLQFGKQKIQIVQEVSQLKKLIQESNLERNELLIQLGEEVYKKIRMKELSNENWSTKVAALSIVDLKIYQAQQAITEINKASVQQNACPNCQNPITSEDKFCGSCGTKVEQEKPVDNIETVDCTICEEQIPISSKFCPCCGTQRV
ncbi:zinc ribbon domain-containing protein [Bacillus sp. FJAT-42315]|uniref:zinc ribbon domain-containing protein n=1 Tax=Bacillus sp. FJAT-42315 TaxID=2014077 RepID=UPI000C245BB5|nr:zinc ribbon domain-containing protein [Bacillus sp. FJAT-42315]